MLASFLIKHDHLIYRLVLQKDIYNFGHRTFEQKEIFFRWTFERKLFFIYLRF